MICVKIQAGFGNQLFQYAMGYSLAKKTGQELVLDLSFNRFYNRIKHINKNVPSMYKQCYLNYVNIKYSRVIGNSFKHWYQLIKRKLGLKRIMVDGKILEMRVEDFDNCREYQPHIIENIGEKGAYFEGYWQNYAYFDDVKDELSEMFTPNYKFNDEVQKLYDEINSRQSVGVHIRRGDFVKLGWDRGIDFYLGGMNKIKSMLPDCYFYIVTDDKDWAREKLKSVENCTVVDIKSHQQDIDEFFMLKACKNHVISKSTFGWWAAYLNQNKDKIVVVPKGYAGALFVNDWIAI